MKKQKKWLIIFGNALVIYALCFLGHSIFEWFPNKATAIFFPVNESIWEHMKLLFTSYAIWMIIGTLLKNWTCNHNLLSTFLLTATINIILYLAIYLPIYFWLGEQMIFTLIWLFISILLCQCIAFYRLQREEKQQLELTALLLIPIFFTIFGYLTYHPIKNELFYDPIQKKYGLSTLEEEK